MIYDDHFFKIEDQLTAVLDTVKSSAVFATYRQKRENLYNDSTAMQLKSVFEAKKISLSKLLLMEILHLIIGKNRDRYVKQNEHWI